ncbi:hypothetical protein Acr_03g0019240 [Actinidia rufa]|uniref:Uncharacterized protein n=1 Tax=Actinidia rufa TaxID=165716 RepID=A0A7J0EFJ1_9ERIC|nr:hypothetical protein Acr_03g0019240 [Actinidia rufa]
MLLLRSVWTTTLDSILTNDNLMKRALHKQALLQEASPKLGSKAILGSAQASPSSKSPPGSASSSEQAASSPHNPMGRRGYGELSLIGGSHTTLGLGLGPQLPRHLGYLPKYQRATPTMSKLGLAQRQHVWTHPDSVTLTPPSSLASIIKT